ncbi:SNF2-related protein [[Mycoplasma] gypis]|uniref:SNF2-related protein n=1 Tax=[Mycoplasma] gypis TaxID=92404 RepID=A0ABZ2RNQ8_9BACT|nr:SNF2-related protein [[Mycoplasma] gypis]MBN0919452.1 DEAD/DEAH box helicase family protein [[Mycoplasma] gypis]
MLEDLELFKHQKDAVKEAQKYDRYIFQMGMGTGKTLASLYWLYDQQQNQNNNLPTLAIVDPNTVDGWMKTAQTLDLDVVFYKGIAKIKQIPIELENNKLYLLTYDNFRSWTKKQIVKINKKINLIFDESQALKDPYSKISQTMLKYSPYFKKLLFLTGDPLSNSFENLYLQLYLIGVFDPLFTYKDFLQHFCITIPNPRQPWNYKNPQVIGYKNIEYLKSLLWSRAFVIDSDEAFKLPQTHTNILPSQVGQEYRSFLRHKVLKVGEDIIQANSTIEMMHSLRMLASGVIKTNEGNYLIVDNSKYKKLLQIIKQLPKQNIVVFYNYKAEVFYIKEILKRLNIKYFVLNGEANELAQAKESKERFIFLVHFQSGARGVDGMQHFSNHQVYFSPPTSGELYKQSLKRVHRIGQTKEVFYFYLTTTHSIEPKIYDKLKKSQNFTLQTFKKYANWKE